MFQLRVDVLRLNVLRVMTLIPIKFVFQLRVHVLLLNVLRVMTVIPAVCVLMMLSMINLLACVLKAMLSTNKLMTVKVRKTLEL